MVRVQNIVIKCSTALLALIIFAIPFEHKYDKPLRRLSEKIIPKNLFLPEFFDKKIYFYASDIAALLLFIAALIIFKEHRKSLFIKKETLCLWAIFLCAIGSLLSSPFSGYALVYTRLFQLFTPFALFAWITQIPASEKRTTTSLNTFVISALIQSVIAILQYFRKAPLGLRLFSEPQHATGTFFVPGGKRWIFDHLFPYVSSPEVWRSCGTLPHCNVLGGFLFVSILASYALIIEAKQKKVRYLLGLSLILQTFALSITYSRSAIFATALGTVVWFFWAFLKQGIRSILTAPSYRFLILMITTSVLINLSLLGEQYLYRGGILNYNTCSATSDMIRISLQNVSLKMIQDHAITGVGFQQFSSSSLPYLSPNEYPAGTHNIYLFLTAEMGIFAGLALLIFICIIGNAIRKASFSPKLASLISLFIGFLFIGGCDFYPILYQQGKLMFFIISALLFFEAKKQIPKVYYATSLSR